jgi:ATP-dependent helicase/nuclease subunit B
MNCYTIPSDKPFLPTLADWILRTHGNTPENLTKILILLPNRRSCRSMREAFLAQSRGKPLLLPRIQPLGDVDEGYSPHYGNIRTRLPPAVPLMRREFLLARLVMRHHLGQVHLSQVQALELARQLAKLMDEVSRQGLSFEHLDSLVEGELAKHWQDTVQFLRIVSHEWPGLLEHEALIDPIDHRNRMLDALCDAWSAHPPQGHVIAAGSTGSAPATARLLSVIAKMPRGKVVLPGLDVYTGAREWETVEETHPQYAMRRLLETMECPRVAVRSLDGEPALLHAETPRAELLRAVLQPPESTMGWAQAKLPLEKGVGGIRLLFAETHHEEARLVAVALREALEIPGRTAALVTADRTLARMVSAQMQRFGIEIDDSAGHPLLATPPAGFMRLLMQMVGSHAAPAALLALLRHPLAAAGYATAQCRSLSRALEMELLRGLRLSPGLATLHDKSANAEVRELLLRLQKGLEPLLALGAKPEVPLGELLQAHVACAQWLATSDTQPGHERLWSGEAGRGLAQLMAELVENAPAFGEVPPAMYPRLFDTLLAGQSYYPRFGRHPRLHILSPMEARLQHFDLVVLAGLNEGSWPQASPVDPWMSRPMRKAFRLPSQQREVGQSAHDFALLAAGGDVLLSRALKVDGAPTIASRWLVRLETLIGGLDPALLNAMDATAHYSALSRWLERPAGMLPIGRPAPKPPMEHRPRTMGVTNIDTWLEDPYQIYARYVLGLRELKDIDEEPDNLEFGNYVHDTLELFAARYPAALPENPLEKLRACGAEVFEPLMVFPAVETLWWPRFEAVARWIVDREKQRRPDMEQLLAEVKGTWSFDVAGRPFTLITRIDRIERHRDGSLSFVDYKTGGVPSAADVKAGRRNQLLLEALIARHGTLQPQLSGPLSIRSLQYWKLTPRYEEAAVIEVPCECMESAHERLIALIRRFDNPGQAYAPPQYVSDTKSFNRYASLERRQEWGEG